MARLALAAEPWDPPEDGEIARQFPKHPTRHIEWFSRRSDGGIEEIGLQRTACYGTCPVYTFVIRSDGAFRYHGESYARKRGNWRGTVDPSQLNRLLLYVAEMHYFDLADLYGNHETDGPGAFILVKTHTRKKVIYDYGHTAPACVMALEDMMDHLLDSAKWQRDKNR